MNGADFIAEFLKEKSIKNIFTVTGGACAFIIDAVSKCENLNYVCFQHEQAAAMAADAVWRIQKTPGVTLVTSGPGATNLITGIACSYFDSIPSIHITGQVNLNESAKLKNLDVRQIGFQETNIVEMVKPITKYSVKVETIQSLSEEFNKAYNIATSGRMGPVLLDIPMNIQQEKLVKKKITLKSNLFKQQFDYDKLSDSIFGKLKKSSRPLILFGAGVGLSGIEKKLTDWMKKSNIPFVSSWGGISYFDHRLDNYCGHIGVYGNRGANFIIQNCDYLLVLGSRLDSRQRSSNEDTFAPIASIDVIDIDGQELKKFQNSRYSHFQLDLQFFPKVLDRIEFKHVNSDWESYIKEMKNKYYDKDLSQFANDKDSLSPYGVIKKINSLIHNNAIVVSDCGANLCWVYQIFKRTQHKLFTAAGHSPMGYTLPAIIGSAISSKGHQVIGFIGDGGFQMNIQELQTIVHYKLNTKIIVLNNFGYGIIKQFQDSYFNSRYEASGEGYSQPDFRKIANAYKIEYFLIRKISDLKIKMFENESPAILDVFLDPNTLIEPKIELGHPINNQFPYLSNEEREKGNKFLND